MKQKITKKNIIESLIIWTGYLESPVSCSLLSNSNKWILDLETERKTEKTSLKAMFVNCIYNNFDYLCDLIDVDLNIQNSPNIFRFSSWNISKKYIYKCL